MVSVFSGVENAPWLSATAKVTVPPALNTEFQLSPAARSAAAISCPGATTAPVEVRSGPSYSTR